MKAGNRLEVKIADTLVMVEGQEGETRVLVNIGGRPVWILIPNKSLRDFAACCVAIGKTLMDDRTFRRSMEDMP